MDELLKLKGNDNNQAITSLNNKYQEMVYNSKKKFLSSILLIGEYSSGTAHTHTWVDVTKTVHHDKESHVEKRQTGTKTVVDQEAWDEDIKETRAVCNKCGYSSKSGKDVAMHIVDEHDGDASYSAKSITVDTKHHDAVTHEEPVYEDVTIVDKEAWDETVVTGQRCSICGATK